MTHTPAKTKKTPRWLGWAVAVAAALAAAVGLWYFWRVFYYLDARGGSLSGLLAGLCALGLGAVAAVWVAAKKLRGLPARGAWCIFLCGLLFAFANPPLQTPDETNYYLRSYSISQGYFNFDYDRLYPEDVTRLYNAFNGAWVTSHTSQGLTTDSEGNEVTYNTAGYALKQYGEQGRVESVADSFAEYFSSQAEGEVHEPLCFMILPFVPQAVGMLLARLLGLGALGCLYAGRIANLALYAALGWLTLKNCRQRFAPVFLALLLLPLSLYMAASNSYDALLLACYYYMLSFLAKEGFTRRDAVCFLAAMVWVNIAKPYINLLWAVIPLLILWRDGGRLKKAGLTALAGVAGALAVTRLTDWYGQSEWLRFNYPPYGRMLGEDVSQLPQLAFILQNPLRFLAVLWGTLYENDFFVGQLGVFGNLDLPVALLNLSGAAALVLAAALAVEPVGRGLGRKSGLGLATLGVVYLAGCMTAMYITYTPVGMVRVIGLQARYFLPVFLIGALLLSRLLARVLRPAAALAEGRARQNLALAAFALHGFVGALLLFQHYFIGPVYTIG